jgi:hypothetical protein
MKGGASAKAPVASAADDAQERSRRVLVLDDCESDGGANRALSDASQSSKPGARRAPSRALALCI